MNWRIVRGLLIKIGFVCTRSPFRIGGIFFWPFMELLLWGFVTMYMLKVSNAIPAYITFLFGAIILWNILFRTQQSVSLAFLDDVWARNLLNVFAAPVRNLEYITSTYLAGLIQVSIQAILLGTLSFLFYSFNILKLGPELAFLFANLLFMGWWLGLLTIGLLLRFGPAAEMIAWAIPSLLQPVSAVFYPVSILPVWLQKIALVVPSSHVFEGMRQIMITGHADPHHIWCAIALNAVYMALCGWVFNTCLEGAREQGLLARYAS